MPAQIPRAPQVVCGAPQSGAGHRHSSHTDQTIQESNSRLQIPESGIIAAMVTRMVDDVVALRSKVLFGNRHLLAVAAAVADLGPVLRARELEEGMGLPASTVHRSLATLVGAGLLRREPRERAEREQRYTRSPHPFWEAVRLLRDDAPAERGGAGRGRAQ